MDDIKQKFKDLLNRSRDDQADDQLNSSTAGSLYEELGLGLTAEEIKLLSRDPENTLRENLSDPLADQEILETIEAAFVGEKCDGGRYQLLKLPQVIDLIMIRAERQRLLVQLGAVTRKLFSVILQNQSSCAEELNNVLDMQDELDTALGTCKSGRLQLNRATQHLTVASLKLLALYRRKQRVLDITKSLKTIRTLERMGQRVQELLNEENYAGAIQLLVEGQKAAQTYKHFSCVAQLSARLNDTLELAEEQLDAGLARICRNFDPVLYEKLQCAFTLLGKQNVALDQLNLHLASSLHHGTFTLVGNFVQLTNSDKQVDIHKIQFQDLCRHISSELFIPCLRDLFRCFWNILVTFQKISQWHAQRPYSNESEQAFVQQKFQHGRIRLWQDIQSKARTFILASDLWHFSIDEFLHVLDIIDRLIEVGSQFCNSQSEILEDSVRQQSINYFRRFHQTRLDELRVFLENEVWEPCPVRKNFTVLQLAEFHFLQEIPQPSENNQDQAEDFFSVYEVSGTPFDNCGLDNTTSEDILPPRKKDDGDQSDNEEDPSESVKDQPLISNTTLSVLRLYGRYVHFMRLLKPIAFDVLICLNQLFDFYLFAVYLFFGNHPQESCHSVMSPSLRNVIKRIGDNLIAESNHFETDSGFQNHCNKVPAPQMTSILNLTKSEDLFGFRQRLVASESVVFLAKQMELLKPILEALVPQEKAASLQQFVSHTLAVAQDLRMPVYTSVACRSLDLDHILSLMGRVQWDLKEVMSQHSSYIDIILQSLEELKRKVEEIAREMAFPAEVYNILWDQTIRSCYRTLLEGFASGRKCTNEGRALMQLDLRQLQLKLEGLTRLRPLPDAALVETYIKAFYLPESSLDQWVQQHPEYSAKQLSSLVQCVGQANKKTRLRLTALMEELDLNRK